MPPAGTETIAAAELVPGGLRSMPGSAPGVDGGPGGLPILPALPGGKASGGPNGSATCEFGWSIWFAGMRLAQGSKVGPPSMPGFIGVGTAPLPGGGGSPGAAGCPIFVQLAPGTNGSLTVVVPGDP
jgi:hypothetical protein